MKNLILTAAFCILTVASMMAQKDRTLFNSFNLSGAWGGNQTQVTQFNGELGILSGGFGGVEFNKNFFIGAGRYTSTTHSLIDQAGDNYEMGYGGLVLGYGFKSHKLIHPQATLLAGTGWTEEAGFGRDNVFVAQPGIGVEINVFRWMRVGLHGGYRVALGDNDFTVVDDFTDAYGSISFKFGWSWGR